MTRQDALDALSTVEKHLMPFTTVDAQEALGALKVLRKYLETTQCMEWTKVDKHLSPDGEKVLICFNNWDEIEIGRCDILGDGAVFFKGDTYDSYVCHGIYPLAWMNLPERLKEKDVEA